MLPERIDTEKLKHRLLLVLFESMLIVLGVLLGYFANQWRITQANERKADNAVRAISEELQGNYEQVEKLLPEHRRMDDSLDVLLKRVATGRSTRVSPMELREAMPEGFSTPLLRSNAWELAGQTGAINYIDFELVKDLSRLYNVQDFYQSKLDRVGENWYVAGNLNPSNFASTAMATGILVNDIVFQEEDLVEEYPEMIERLNSVDP